MGCCTRFPGRAWSSAYIIVSVTLTLQSSALRLIHVQICKPSWAELSWAELSWGIYSITAVDPSMHGNEWTKQYNTHQQLALNTCAFPSSEVSLICKKIFLILFIFPFCSFVCFFSFFLPSRFLIIFLYRLLCPASIVIVLYRLFFLANFWHFLG